MNKIIVFAAGGGNDVFSTVAYIKAHLHKKFEEIAIVSVLGFTPFHSNTEIKANEPNFEFPLIQPTSDMRRYLLFNNPKEIMCMEKLIPSIVKEFVPEIKKYICMSPKYSASEQAANLLNLFTEWKMFSNDTLLNIVDFGGDILTDGAQSSIISPELDAYTLAVVKNLATYKSNVSVCFPGVDGELSADYLSEKCNNNSIAKYKIDKIKWYDVLICIHERLENHRPGNTIPNMISVLNNTRCKLSKSWNVGGNKFTFIRDFEVNMEFQKYIYVFNLIDNNPFVDVFNCDNYDLVKVIKHIVEIYSKQNITVDTVQSSDFFLQFLRKDADGAWTNKYFCNNEQVMLIDIIPTVILNRKDEINENIKLLKTFDILFSCN
jgi:hypothetical protein